MSGATGPGSRKDQVLTAERAVNERYLREVARRSGASAAAARRLPTTRNQLWTGSANLPNPGPEHCEPLAGRVALGHDDPLLGRGFYVSSWHEEWDGVQVVSWAAPVASLFYEGRRSNDAMAGAVDGRRSFVSSHDDLVDYDDELEQRPNGAPSPFVNADAALTVPRAPSAVRRPMARRSEAASAPTPESAQPAALPLTAGRNVRAASAVEMIINQPRTGRLGSLLATLQPGQYRLVTWPEDRPLVVQGQPGTGKTVVATHRAAWLLHSDRDPDRSERQTVALVGPTDAFVEHVAPVLRQLCDADAPIVVLSLQRLLSDLVGVVLPVRHSSTTSLDTAWSQARLLARAAANLRAAGMLRGSRAERMRTLVRAVADSDAVAFPTGLAEGLVAWAAPLGAFDRAAQDDRFLPFLAAAACAVEPPARRWDHLLIDEAQDVRPLEWRILLAHLKGDREHCLSVFGDLNQRRSDWSAASWAELARDLDLTGDDDTFEPELLETGFRSTQRILRFANALLNGGSRRPGALREGVDPICQRVTRDALPREAISAALSLLGRHSAGLVAIISVQPKIITDALRKRDWRKSTRRSSSWSLDGRTVTVLHPADARGLEFDGVVVVEPADFPTNLGRHGTLYTSLTRATQELAVIHARPLPGRLRAPRG